MALQTRPISCLCHVLLFLNSLFFYASPSSADKIFAQAPPTVGISYKNGKVITDPINLYVVWYGDWQADEKSILKDLIASLSKDVASGTLIGTVNHWWQINTLYYNKIGIQITSNITLKSEKSTKYFGNTISFAKKNIPALLDKVIDTSKFVKDKYGVYVIFTSENTVVYDQLKTGGFCQDYDGFHGVKLLNSTLSVPFIFVGNPNTQCPRKYTPIAETTPNGNVGVDSMVNSFSALLSRTATSVNYGTGWVSPSGLENAQLCTNTFGRLFTAFNQQTGEQYLYNLLGVKGRKFLIQQNYNPTTGYCTLQYTG